MALADFGTVEMDFLITSIKDAAIGADIALIVRTYAAQLIGFVAKKAVGKGDMENEVHRGHKNQKIFGRRKSLQKRGADTIQYNISEKDNRWIHVEKIAVCHMPG